MIDNALEDRRSGFVDSLLNADSSVKINLGDVGDSLNENEASELFDEQFSAAGFHGT